jgi:endonuclease YncB( thermonuclease family)
VLVALGGLSGCATVVEDAPADLPSTIGESSTGTRPTTEPPVGVAVGQVSHVVDGDTLDVAGVGRIRVIGIDTPERGECGFESATLAMGALVDRRVVSLVPGARDDADQYGRLLRYVDVDGVDAGLELIRQGWAIARYDSRDGYGPHTREGEYVAADASSDDLGCYPD